MIGVIATLFHLTNVVVAKELSTGLDIDSYSPYAEQTYPSNVFWGDTHLHTNLSWDAYNFGNKKLGPEEVGEALECRRQARVASFGAGLQLWGPAALQRPGVVRRGLRHKVPAAREDPGVVAHAGPAAGVAHEASPPPP